MTYEINVSLDGTHLFATHKRSVDSLRQLKRVYPVIMDKFPECEGYEVTVSICQKTKETISDVPNYLKEIYDHN